MTEHKSRVEHMARVLTRVAVVLLVLFLGAAIGGIRYVDSEFHGDSSLFHYLLVIATAGPLLVAAMIAWVGANVIRALGRVRGSLLDALMPRLDDLEPPPPELTRVDR